MRSLISYLHWICLTICLRRSSQVKLGGKLNTTMSRKISVCFTCLNMGYSYFQDWHDQNTSPLFDVNHFNLLSNLISNSYWSFARKSYVKESMMLGGGKRGVRFWCFLRHQVHWGGIERKIMFRQSIKLFREGRGEYIKWCFDKSYVDMLSMHEILAKYCWIRQGYRLINIYSV